jgi:hypothetical protein
MILKFVERKEEKNVNMESNVQGISIRKFGGTLQGHRYCSILWIDGP